MSMSISHMIMPETADPELARYLVRDKESFAHAQEITKPFGKLDPVIKWCKTELESDWRWQMVSMANDRDPGRYIFYFDSERDCCAFVLKWC